MATSRNSGHSDAGTFPNSLLDGLPLSRYDALLVAIPLGFLLSLTASLVLPVSFRQAVAAGAVFGLLSLLDALYLNPPGEPPSGNATR
jgi:hypothetical protein